MKSVHLIFPHQLFEASPLFKITAPIYLIEEFLFFKQYPFHKQKIAFHRATMKSYETFLKSLDLEVHYIESRETISDIRKLIPTLSDMDISHINYIDTVDNWLEHRIQRTCLDYKITTTSLDSPLFLNSNDDLSFFFKKEKKKYYQTSFYTSERKKKKNSYRS